MIFISDFQFQLRLACKLHNPKWNNIITHSNEPLFCYPMDYTNIYNLIQGNHGCVLQRMWSRSKEQTRFGHNAHHIRQVFLGILFIPVGLNCHLRTNSNNDEPYVGHFPFHYHLRVRETNGGSKNVMLSEWVKRKKWYKGCSQNLLWHGNSNLTVDNAVGNYFTSCSLLKWVLSKLSKTQSLGARYGRIEGSHMAPLQAATYKNYGVEKSGQALVWVVWDIRWRRDLMKPVKKGTWVKCKTLEDFVKALLICRYWGKCE